MPTKAKRHIHKYHRVNLGVSQKVWACAHSDCYHYVPQVMNDMVPGKQSLCWQCGESMKLDPENMKLDEPICFNCMHPEFIGTDDNLTGPIDIVGEYLRQQKTVTK